MPSTYKSTCPPGTIVDYSAAGVANGNFLLCDGGSITEVTFPDLFDAIGITWGTPGAGQFNVPDFRGRASVGTGTGAISPAPAAGQVGGVQNQAISLANMPAHNHGGGNHEHDTNMDAVLSGVPAGSSVRANGIDDGSVVVAFSGTIIATQGSGTGHNNLQPYAAVTKMIKV